MAHSPQSTSIASTTGKCGSSRPAPPFGIVSRTLPFEFAPCPTAVQPPLAPAPAPRATDAARSRLAPAPLQRRPRRRAARRHRGRRNAHAVPRAWLHRRRAYRRTPRAARRRRRRRAVLAAPRRRAAHARSRCRRGEARLRRAERCRRHLRRVGRVQPAHERGHDRRWGRPEHRLCLPQEPSDRGGGPGQRSQGSAPGGRDSTDRRSCCRWTRVPPESSASAARTDAGRGPAHVSHPRAAHPRAAHPRAARAASQRRDRSRASCATYADGNPWAVANAPCGARGCGCRRGVRRPAARHAHRAGHTRGVCSRASTAPAGDETDDARQSLLRLGGPAAPRRRAGRDGYDMTRPAGVARFSFGCIPRTYVGRPDAADRE